MGILPYLDDLAELGVSHVTITVSAVDPAIGARIYAWVKDGNVVYRGEKGAEILLDRQLKAIKGLKERGITVKINSIVIPGINDHHIVEVAKVCASLGADIQNMIPLKPTADTPFAGIPEPGRETVLPLRKEATPFIEQMTHCKRCRADAVGLLGDDQSTALCGTLQACSRLKPLEATMARPFVAVATREGLLVNQHLGEAKSFQIWGEAETGGYRLIEERPAPQAGCGPKRWSELAALLKDCRAVLCAAVGETPRMLLEEHDIKAHTVDGFIEDALRFVFEGGDINALKVRRAGIGSGCAGGGAGCG
jgi:nitrogen fixation protein NifB